MCSKIKKLVFIVAMASMVVWCISCTVTQDKVNKSIAKKKAKAEMGNLDSKLKELKEEGWKIDDSNRTLELAILEHYSSIKEGGDNMYVIEADVSMCRSLNVCRANALNNALREYADVIGSSVKGKAMTDMQNNASASKPEEFDKFYAAYARNVEASAKNVLRKSYALVKEKADGSKEYKIIYLIDERKASESRKEAMRRSIEETKLGIEYGLWIEKFVNETPDGFKKANE